MVIELLAGEFDPPYGDMDDDDDVDLTDFAYFAERWQDSGCSAENDWCGGADINESGDVDKNDLKTVAVNWLADI